jgi:hypothetical protein
MVPPRARTALYVLFDNIQIIDGKKWTPRSGPGVCENTVEDS